MKRKIDNISSTVRVIHDEREDRIEHLHGGRWTVVNRQYHAKRSWLPRGVMIIGSA